MSGNPQFKEELGAAEVDLSGNLKVNIAVTNFGIPSHDYISANFAGATTDVYTFKSGGSGGTTVATVTITYTDSTKAVISTVART
jgi:hypothetical protein